MGDTVDLNTLDFSGEGVGVRALHREKDALSRVDLLTRGKAKAPKGVQGTMHRLRVAFTQEKDCVIGILDEMEPKFRGLDSEAWSRSHPTREGPRNEEV